MTRDDGASPGEETGEDTHERSLAALTEAVHDALAATEERPVTREAGLWLGEAQAVVRDLVDRPADPDVVADRLERVRELLGHVDGTGDDEADALVRRARERTRDGLRAVRRQGDDENG